MLGKQFDPKSNHAEDVREFYRQQGEERLYVKIREAVNGLTDLNVIAQIYMLLNEIRFGEVSKQKPLKMYDEDDKNV